MAKLVMLLLLLLDLLGYSCSASSHSTGVAIKTEAADFGQCHRPTKRTNGKEQLFVQPELKNLEIVCDNEPEHPEKVKKNARRRRRKRQDFFNDIIISNLISVLTGSLANDFTMSSTWDKIIRCYQILFKEGQWGRGWKRCADYWSLGNQKWRNVLKPHLVIQLHRLAAEKLKEIDPSLRHYKAAMIQIQEEYNQLILDGIQQARLLSLLRTANLQLPDFQWLQAEMLNPGETFVKMLEMDWQDTTTQFQRTFRIFTKTLDILEKEFGEKEFIHKIKSGKKLNDLTMEKGKFIVYNPHLSSVKPNWTMLQAESITDKDEVGAFLELFLERTGNLLRNRTAANQFFLHAAISALTMHMIDRIVKQEAVDATQKQLGINNIRRLRGMGKCLLALIRASADGKNVVMQKEYGIFEGPAEALHEVEALLDMLPLGKENKTQQNFLFDIYEQPNRRKTRAVTYEGKKKFSEVVLKKYADIFDANDSMHQTKEPDNGSKAQQMPTELDQCLYTISVLELDFGMLDEELRVQLDAKSLGLEQSIEGVAMIGEIEKDIEEFFKPQHAQIDKRKLNKLDGEKRNEFEYILVHLHLVTLGHVFAKELVEQKNRLNELAGMLNQQLEVDLRKPEHYKKVAFELLEKIFNLFGKKQSLEKKMAALVKSFFGNWEKGIQKADNEFRRNWINARFEKLENNLKEWLDVTQVIMPNPEAGKADAVPLRLSSEMLRLTIDQVEWANDVRMAKKGKSVKNVDADPVVGQQHPRKKRELISAIFWGLGSGFAGNWLSQYIDISLTMRSAFRGKFEIIRTDDVLRKQREKKMLNFLDTSFKILLTKLLQIDPCGNHQEDLYEKLTNFIWTVLHGETIYKSEEIGKVDKLKLDQILIRLEIISYKEIRHIVERIIEDEHHQAVVILRMLQRFSQQKWLEFEDCKKYHERIMLRVGRHECQEANKRSKMNKDCTEIELVPRWWFPFMTKG